MSERSVEQLLRDLDTPIEPERRFSARLREIVAAELRQAGATSLTDNRIDAGSAAGDTREVTEVLLAERPTQPDGTRSRRRVWWAATAAAVVLVAGVTAVVMTAGNDRDATTVTDRIADPTDEAGDPDSEPAVEPATYLDAVPDVVDVDTRPYHVALNGDDAWVLSLSGDLLHLDATTGEELTRSSVPHSSMLAATAGAVWIADAVTGDVLRIDAATNEQTATVVTDVRIVENTIRLGTAFAETARDRFSQIGGIASDGESLWVGDRDGRLLQIDPESSTIVAEIPTPVTPNVVDVDGSYVMSADNGQEVVVHDTSTGEVVVTQTIDRLVGADLHDGVLYLLPGATGAVTRIDLATGDVLRSEPLGEAPRFAAQPLYPAGVRVGPAGVVVESNGWRVLDPATLDDLGALEIDGNAGQMAVADDGVMWIARYTNRTVVRLEPGG